MKNSEKIILDLCGGTGSWSEPYRKAGYDVRLITLPEHSVELKSIDDTTLTFLRTHYSDERIVIPLKSIYGILAAPPCTMFSRARSKDTNRDFKAAMATVEACLDIIWAARSANTGGKLHPGLKFWALENPMGLLRQFLGNPPHSFRGWEWGDEHVKFTDLWGYYRMPTPKFKAPVAFNMAIYASPKAPEHLAHMKLDRAAIRAITPPGFAQAFMEANR